MALHYGLIGNTPLHMVQSVEDAREFLNEYGVHSINSFGDTALHYCNDKDICKALIDNGADVNVLNITGMSPLHFALDSEIALELILNGANVRQKSIMGLTPLHMAMDPDISDILIQYGADIDAVDNGGNTPLHETCNLSVMRLLLDRGAHIDKRNSNGETSLMKNCSRYNDGLFGTGKLIRLLLDCGASPYLIDNLGLGIKDMNIHRAYILVEMIQDNRAKNELIVSRNLYMKKYHETYIQSKTSNIITHDSEDIFRNIISYL